MYPFDFDFVEQENEEKIYGLPTCVQNVLN